MDDELRQMIEEVEALRRHQEKKVPTYLENRRNWVAAHLPELDDYIEKLQASRQSLVDLKAIMVEDSDVDKKRLEVVKKVLAQPEKGSKPFPKEEKEHWKKLIKEAAARMKTSESTERNSTKDSYQAMRSATAEDTDDSSSMSEQAREDANGTPDSRTLDSDNLDDSILVEEMVTEGSPSSSTSATNNATLDSTRGRSSKVSKGSTTKRRKVSANSSTNKFHFSCLMDME